MKIFISLLFLQSSFVFSNPLWRDFKSLRASMEYLAAGDLSCEQQADCGVVSYGKGLGCGGPLGFDVTSYNNSHLRAYQVLDDQLVKIGKKLPIVGTCEVKVPPKMACVSNTCVELESFRL